MASIFTIDFVKRLALTLLIISVVGSSAARAAEGGEDFAPGDLIMHHVMDDHIWHFFDGHYGTLYLPVIVYSGEKGFEVFSSSNFYDENHNLKPYKGYELSHGHITIAGRDETVLDLSITKNVLMLFINSTVLLLVFMAVANGYKKRKGSAPKGIQSFFEPVIVFLRDEVFKPNIGPRWERYAPYLLTLFFFILFGNILGLFPGAANLTGNIAVTFVLAVMTFLYTNLSGNKHYWKHIFNTPGVPAALKPIIVPVEIVGMFTKPISLMIRLFVAITAGHIVILSLISLTFMFQSAFVGIGSSIIVLFINLIELLVAVIQAYVFTMFSALYIGLAVEDHDEHHEDELDEALA
ncbi:MAG: F0F1 ATP synthase subunit A [Candidatus Cyclobacteriaceae bacterium M2_1C_046]